MADAAKLVIEIEDDGAKGAPPSSSASGPDRSAADRADAEKAAADADRARRAADRKSVV